MVTGALNDPSGPCRFAARLDLLPQLIAHARDVCRAAGLTPATVLRIELVIEELFTNTVLHGYGHDCDAPVWLHLEIAPGELRLTYADAAPPFDLLEHDIGIAASAADRPVGGLGVHLVKQLASAISYRRAEDRNVLTILFRPGA